MERIIIREQDNTSNVEALSSYDVAYVPGFANSPTASYFRNPQLVTTTYQFKNLFGDIVPKFSGPQYYPIADATTYGFPARAIPNFVEPVDSDYEEYKKWNGYDADPLASQDDITDGCWSKVTGVTETTFTKGLHGFTTQNTDTRNADNKWYVYYPESYVAGKTTYLISSSPTNKGLWEQPQNSTSYVPTEDAKFMCSSQKTSPIPTKKYYKCNNKPSVMFEANSADPGYRYALYLLSLGIPVYYEQMNRGAFGQDDYVSISVNSMYDGLMERFSSSDSEGYDYSFDSPGDYTIKYITSGGYPTLEYGKKDSTTYPTYTSSPLATSMIEVAYRREDSIALIDHTNNPDRPLVVSDPDSVFSVVNGAKDGGSGSGPGLGLENTKATYGTLFTPWYSCSHSAITGGVKESTSNYIFDSQMPGSLAFLSALSYQIKNYNPWLAVSGVSRGLVPYCNGLHTNKTLTNNIADSYQTLPKDDTGSISINPITYIRNYGTCIWGNRTLRNNKSGTKATSFLNVRNFVSDIKKTLFSASQQLMFEQNNDILWVNFKSIITPLLNTMVSNYIIDRYSLSKLTVDSNGNPVPAYELMAVIRVVPIDSVEVFDLTVSLSNKDVTVTAVEE